MRFVQREHIGSDTVLAKPIFGPDGRILLAEGVAMTDRYVQRLEELGIGGVYIHDTVSEGVEIVDALSDETRSYAVNTIHSVFAKATQDKGNPRVSSKAAVKTAQMIVDEILSKGDVILNLMDMRSYDNYTFFHSVNVTVLSVIMGIEMGMGRGALINQAIAAMLHDIGKIFIDVKIINKSGKLTPEEYAVIQKHPRDGYEYIRNKFYVDVPVLSAVGVLDHHERIDGLGYPDNKRDEEITTYGRIITVADVYDALISDRPYRKGIFPLEVMEYIQGNCGTMFDYDIVNAFSRKVALFPVGTCVLLSNDTVGLVMENYEGFAQRPMLKILKHGEETVTPYMLNLSEEAFDVTVVSTHNYP